MDMSVIEDRKARARAWFEALRNDICAAFERLEDEAPASLYQGQAGRFVRTLWDPSPGYTKCQGRETCEPSLLTSPAWVGTDRPVVSLWGESGSFLPVASRP